MDPHRQENIPEENNSVHDDSFFNPYEQDGIAQNKNIQDEKDLNSSEESAGSWKDSTSENGSTNRKGRFSFVKKRGAIGLLGLFGISGGLLAFFLPFSLPFALSNMIETTNNSSGVTLERRTGKVLRRLMTKTDPGSDGSLCSAKKISCKNNRLSRAALKRLDKIGITATVDGKPVDLKSTGKYTTKNPTEYKITLTDGKTVTKKPSQIQSYLRDNPKVGAKVYGKRGILNMRVKAWAGKTINTRFFKKVGISRDGGAAKKEKGDSSEERKKGIKSRLSSKVPKLGEITDKVNPLGEKIGENTKEKMRKGNTVYMTAFASCIALKGPSIIAAGAAAAQLQQLLPLISYFVLSPGAQTQASGVDTTNAVSPEGLSDAASILTEKDKNGQSALDSPALQAAIGVNSNKVSTDGLEDFMPGHSVISNPAMKTGFEVQKTASSTCNAVMNPLAMYTFLAIDAALKPTLVGLLSSAATFAASFAVEPLIKEIIEKGVGMAVNKLVKDIDIDNLRGKELGDALGVSTAAFYSSGGVARFIPTMTEQQAVAFQDVMKEEERKQRSWDIATLSPFDISSPYTFMGNITTSLQRNMITSRVYSGPNKFASSIKSIFSLPFTVFSQTPLSAKSANTPCSYASEFDFEKNDGNTPATTISGLPCVGFSSSLEPEEAENILLSAGWLKAEGKQELDDEDSIDDLVSKGFIEEGTPLSTMITECGDATDGSYLYSGGGCVIPGNVGLGKPTNSQFSPICEQGGEDEEDLACSDNNEASKEALDMGDIDQRALEASAAWLIDYQVAQSIQGFDEDEGGEGEVNNEQESSSVSENSGQISTEGWSYPLKTGTMTTYPNHIGMDMATNVGTKVYAIRDGTVSTTETVPASEVYAYCKNILGPSFHPENQNNILIKSTVDNVSYVHRYAHMSKFNVSEGDTVKAGDLIGWSGNTGCSSGPHLHVDVSVPPEAGLPCDLRPTRNTCYIMLYRFMNRSW